MIDFEHTKLSDFIQNGLKEHGWSGLDFCTMLGGVSKSVGSKIINGKQTPSLMQMVVIAKMFDVSPTNIVQMRIFEESSDFEAPLHLSENHLKLVDIFKRVPVSEMLSHNWVGVHDRNDCEEMTRVFKPYLEDALDTNYLAHKTNTANALTGLQKAWLLRVRSLARSASNVGLYKKELMPDAIEQLKQVMNRQQSLVNVEKIFCNLGIRLVFVECKKSKIDGVCTWLDEKTPVIGMTLRFDRIDNFWFVLRHELRHVEQGSESQSPVDTELRMGMSEVNNLEDDANKVAAEFCISSELVQQFIEDSNGRITDEEVKAFSEEKGVNPAVLAGQIRHRLGKYNILNKLLPSYRNELLETGLLKDGWGYVAG